MIELDIHDSQMILYAKGWFEVTDQLLDVKRILAKRAEVPIEGFRNYDVMICLIDLLTRCKIDVMKVDFFSEVIFGLQYGLIRPETEPLRRFVRAVLGLLSTMQVLDGDTILLKLHPANPDYLPLTVKGEKL